MAADTEIKNRTDSPREPARTRTGPPREETTTRAEPQRGSDRMRQSSTGGQDGAGKLVTVIEELRKAQDMLLAALRGWNDAALANNRTLINDMINASERWLQVQRSYIDTIANAQRRVNSRAMRRFAWPDEE